MPVSEFLPRTSTSSGYAEVKRRSFRMKRMGRILYCIVSVLLVIGLVSCTEAGNPSPAIQNSASAAPTNAEATPTLTPPPTSTPYVEIDNVVGRENGNHFVSIQGNTIYYSFWSGAILRANVEGGKYTQIIQTSADFINVIGDWIYYKNTVGMSGEICRIRTDGSDYSLLVENGFYGGVIATTDSIFYAGSGKNSNMLVWRMDADGTNKTELSSEPSDFLTDLSYVDGWIVYTAIKMSKGTSIIKVRETGEDRTVVASYDDNIWKIVVSDGWAYYICGSSMYKTSLDGSQTIELFSDDQMMTMFDITIADGHIYYMRFTDTTRDLWRVKTDGTGQEEFEPNMQDFYGIAGGWIFFKNEDEASTYMMKLDGSERQKIYAKYYE